MAVIMTTLILGTGFLVYKIHAHPVGEAETLVSAMTRQRSFPRRRPISLQTIDVLRQLQRSIPNRPLDEDRKGKTGSEIIASFAPGARVIKALNTLVVKWIQDYSEKKPKSVLFLSGDDADAKRKLARALEETGFVPGDIGGLIDGGKLHRFGGPLNALHLDLLNRMKF